MSKVIKDIVKVRENAGTPNIIQFTRLRKRDTIFNTEISDIAVVRYSPNWHDLLVNSRKPLLFLILNSAAPIDLDTFRVHLLHRMRQNKYFTADRRHRDPVFQSNT